MDLPTYTNIWRIEKRLYKLYDFRLPMPLPVGQIAVFLAIAVPYVLVLSLLGLPFSHTLLWVYVLPPGVLAWLTTRPVLESKRLPELVLSQLRYVLEPRTWCRMAPLAEKDEIVVVCRVWRQAELAPEREPQIAVATARVSARRARPVARPLAIAPRSASRQVPPSRVAQTAQSRVTPARVVQGRVSPGRFAPSWAAQGPEQEHGVPAPFARGPAAEAQGLLAQGPFAPGPFAEGLFAQGAVAEGAVAPSPDLPQTSAPATSAAGPPPVPRWPNAPATSGTPGRVPPGPSAPEATSSPGPAAHLTGPRADGAGSGQAAGGAATSRPAVQAAGSGQAAGSAATSPPAARAAEIRPAAASVRPSAGPRETARPAARVRPVIPGQLSPPAAPPRPAQPAADEAAPASRQAPPEPRPPAATRPFATSLGAATHPAATDLRGGTDQAGRIEPPATTASPVVDRQPAERQPAAHPRPAATEPPATEPPATEPPAGRPAAYQQPADRQRSVGQQRPPEQRRPAERAGAGEQRPAEERRLAERADHSEQLPAERRRPAERPEPDELRPDEQGPPAAGGPPDAPPSRPARPVVTVTGDLAAERPLRVVERALRSQPGQRPDGWRDRVVVVPGGHRPGKPDPLQRDRARARLPIDGSRRIVVLGCTRGAGQTTTALLAGDMLAGLRAERVAVLDLNPGRGSLSERAAAIPGLVQDPPDTASFAGVRGLVPSGGPLAAPVAIDTQPPDSGLQVITGSAAGDGGGDAGRLFGLVAARYRLTLADPAAGCVPRTLDVADQLVIVAPASAEAANALAMTFEWLEAHGHGRLATAAITVLNGVSGPTGSHVEHAANVANGRCRAIVKIPWDSHLRDLSQGRSPARPEAGPASPVAHASAEPRGFGLLSPALTQAYTALAGVLVAGLADPGELRSAGG